MTTGSFAVFFHDKTVAFCVKTAVGVNLINTTIMEHWGVDLSQNVGALWKNPGNKKS